MILLTPPTPLPPDEPPGSFPRSVFLAGSIDMGTAARWQDDVARALQDLDIFVMNPRRASWDASWEQRARNPLFQEQVAWELAGLDRASVIAMYLAPGSKAPVSLLELGLFARSGRLVVACPDEFYRKGNVEIVGRTYGFPLVSSLPELIFAIRERLLAPPP